MRAPMFNVGDTVLWYGMVATIEEIQERFDGHLRPDYFIRYNGGHAWAPECELEPCESN